MATKRIFVNFFNIICWAKETYKRTFLRHLRLNAALPLFKWVPKYKMYSLKCGHLKCGYRAVNLYCSIYTEEPYSYGRSINAEV